MTVDERTQEIVAQRLGFLLLGSARLQAENEALQAAAAVRDAKGAGEARSAHETPQTEQTNG